MKYSSQRERILSVVRECSDHPTADIVYARLRPEMPNLSLGTVYRNLSLLASIGEIQRIAGGEGPDRFDAITRPHYHVACRRCGRVDDLPLAWEGRLDQQAARHYEGHIEGHTTCFYGLCAACLEEEEAASAAQSIG